MTGKCSGTKNPKHSLENFFYWPVWSSKDLKTLLPAFEKAYLKRCHVSKPKAGKVRTRQAGAGRKGSLESIEQKSLFALVYQKSYLLHQYFW